jgi:F-type H+-transporting ATPase subunit b
MKMSGKRTFRRAVALRVAVLILAAAAFFVFSPVLMASSGSGHAEQAAGQHQATAEHQAAAEHGGGGHGGGWQATDTYRVMNFAVLAIGLFLILRKPVAQTFSNRIKGIQHQLDELEEKKKAAEEELAQYNRQLAKLEEEAETIVQEYIRQGNEARSRILEAAQASAKKLEEQAQRNIESEFKKVKKQLVQDVMEKALAKAEQKIKTSITPDDQNKLVDEYLEKVVA